MQRIRMRLRRRRQEELKKKLDGIRKSYEAKGTVPE